MTRPRGEAVRIHPIGQQGESVDLAHLRETRALVMRAHTGHEWQARRVPILAALAPVMTSTEGEITYPGDPMCLYGAISVTISSAMTARDRGCDTSAPYPDLCPDWGTLPSKEYRLSLADHGIRPAPDGTHASDQCVFDPRVWTDETEDAFRSVLRASRPGVFLVSTVSPGHRYALEMASIVKQEVPDCLVVMGGRHIDETVRHHARSGTVDFAHSSTVRAIWDGRAAPAVDFQISGDAYFALDKLLRAIMLAMDPVAKTASVGRVVAVLDALLAEEPTPGTSVILALDEEVHVFPVSGGKFDLADLPSPYRAFGIRSRFPVFAAEDTLPGRTAHMTVSNACPYHCDFCSESAVLAGGLNLLRTDPAAKVTERVCECVSYGAESLFFDDSVFWSGNFSLIRGFCQALSSARGAAEAGARSKWITDAGDVERLRGLQWGAQFTADLLTTLHKEHEVMDMLHDMCLAGCTYIYLGIESMSEQVMNGVHKNLRRVAGLPWKAKVRMALRRVEQAGIRVGSSVLFGLEGETRDSIDETIEEVGMLIDDGLLMLASPNILTYHPATPLTRLHGMTDQLDYHSLDIANRAPYTYFEEAFPGVVSRRLSEQDIWHIHRSTAHRWGATRNDMEPVAPQPV